MPRPFGLLLLAAGALLFGVYAWFGLVWVLSATAKATGTRALDAAMLIVSPHLAGWFVALGLGAIAFVFGLRLARRHRVSWLGFAGPARESSPAGAVTPLPPRPPVE